jgi:type IV pilus assembly protein PilY1
MITLAKISNKRLLHCLISGVAMALASMQALSAPLSLADTPLFLTASVTPNMVITLDNSLSMSHAHVPDSLGHSAGGNNILSQRRYKSNYYNALYYSPFLTYPIPTRNDGTTYTTSFTTAYVNGLDSGKGSINLSNNYSVTFFYQPDVTAATYTSTTNCAFQNATATGTPVGGWGNTCMRARNPSTDFASASQNAGVAAYYYIFWSQKTGQTLPTNCSGTAAQQKEDEDCYIKINVGSTTAPVDLFAGTQAQQQQNFANWFSFYRTRALSAMSGAITAVNGLSTNDVRLAWQTVNSSGSAGSCTTFGTNCNGYTATTSENRMRPLDALKTGSTTITHRTDFYNWVQRFDLNGSTPLRSVLKRSGEYYKLSGLNSPYAEDPYTTLGTELSCRKDYHVMFTDGLWNSDDNTDFSGNNSNVDSTDATMPDGTAYTAQYPYKNASSAAPSGLSYKNSLADIAFTYWKTDLSTLTNNLTPDITDVTGTTAQQYWNPKNDPATWQHMVNFNVGLGLSSTLTDPVWGGSTYTGDYPALGGNPPFSATKFWPAIDESPTTGNEPVGHVYDLWHAAINSRGQFFSVEDPVALQSAFQSIFSTIVSSNASSAAAAANSTSIQTGTVLYQAQFSSKNWSGHLFSFAVSSNGTVQDLNSDGKLDASDANWDAAALIPTSRNIRTFNGTAGVDFVWGNLSTAQQTALQTSSAGVVGTATMGQDRLNWLRGDTTKEVRFTGGIFRNRTTTVLGDIINSDPMFSYTEDYGYASLPATATERSTYAAFVSGKNSGATLRPPMIYDGANDGMLHAFRADTGNANSGKELFAYIPAAVYGNLSRLTETNYSHTYFVDGSPTVGDAYLSGAWKTVLLGGLGKGGKAIYALNISTPDAFTDAHVLWEYSGSATDTGTTGTTDADGLGLTYSQPQIARLNDGTWAAIFGNGYNSTSERAFLYIVNLSTGALIKKIPTNTTTSNGLSTPKLYDSNNDKIIDFVYAGDLQGNMWKFDLSGTTSTGWGLGNGGNPLFIARNSSNLVQPITAQPTVGAHQNGGVLVYFGTGSYLTTTDVSDTTVQSFYAIWDKPLATTTVARSSLVQQTIIEQVASGTIKTIAGCTDDPAIPGNECVVTFNYTTRGTSANTVDYTSKLGWYMDLLPVSGTAAGERITSVALLKFDRVIFLTAIPSADQCTPGGDSWLMEIDSSTGGRTAISSFDFNNDDKFDDKDKLPSNLTVSGVKSTVGMVKAATWLDKEGTGTAVKEMSGSTSNIMSVKNKGAPVVSGTVNRLYWQQIQ